MSCVFVRAHCYKLMITALALMVVVEYGFGVLYEENQGLNEVYFTFNLTLPTIDAAANGTAPLLNYNGDKMTLAALQSANSSDPFSLDLLDTNDTLSYVRKPSMCPLVSPLLVGRVKVSGTIITDQKWLDAMEAGLEAGGRYHPRNCWANYKVAIIIPYRNRQEHLRLFVQHMHSFLQRQQLNYGIFVVEQSGATPFNRAMLMNIGAAEALRQDDFQCFVFHDVDLLPEDDRNIYSCPEQPRHMSVAINIFKYKLPYDGLFGGVSAMRVDHFIKVNGFSNLFWGWGGEDDDMANRIRFHKLLISRYPPSIARYTMLTHKKARPNPNRFRVLRNGDKRSKKDGLSNLKYKRLDLQLRPLYTHILVDIKPS